MVIGFGANVVTIIMIVVLGITRRNARGIRRKYLSEKVLLHFLPAIGVCMSFYDMVFLLRRALQGQGSAYHEWFSRCSQLSVWVVVLFFSKCDRWFLIFFDWVICLWWIVKPLLEIPHLQKTFSSAEALICLKESCIVLLDIVFGISLNVLRLKQSCSRCSSLEDSLLSFDMDLEEGRQKDSGTVFSCWHHMTFKSITSVMDCGVIKQLDFEDLLQIPIDMDPVTCHDTLLNCLQARQSNDPVHQSLFRAICSAYGWPYLLLGFLKVLNDCIGFAGPLLLNKLIRYLQKGSGHLDGYFLAISLGFTSILKSFLDTQYTFHLSKLKLKLRSSIMTVVYRKCLYVGLSERLKFSEGEIQTFMSVDADRTVNLCNSFHDMWSLPLQIGVALYLLYTQVKFAFVAGTSITILLIPVNKWISELIASATEKMMEQKDERIRKTGELLSYIRTLKMYSWEVLFSSWLMETRSLEVKYLSMRKYLDAWCVFFWATTPTLFSLFTFGLFSLMGHQLDAATVIKTLSQVHMVSQ